MPRLVEFVLFVLFLAIHSTMVGTAGASEWPGPAATSDMQPQNLNKLGIGETFGRWPDGVIPYVYNATGKPAVFSNNANFVALLQSAMAELEGVSGLTFEYQGIDNSAVIGNFADGVVTVGWENLAGAAGQAGPASSCSGQDVIDIGYCKYVDGSVRFNNDVGDIDWDTGVADFTERNFRQVAVHELMHLAGIGHSEVAQSIMYADPYTNLHHLRDDDIDALQSLYGKPDEFAPATIFIPPSAGVSPLQDSFISTTPNIGTPITEIDGSEASTFAGLLWQVPGGHTDDLTIVATDPHGFFYAGGVDDRDCNAGQGGSCGFWTSFARFESMHTFPGVWTVYAIMNGNLVATESVTVTTNPTFNQAPESILSHDVIYGPAPLAVKLNLSVTGDNEGDAVDATWHIPTVGAIPLNSGNFPGGVGENSQTVTFQKPGEYEVYVEVNDDWSRYGSGGNAAGPGFRTLHRVVVRVNRVSDDITAVPDVTSDGIPDLAGFVGGPNGSPQVNVYSGANGNVHTNVKFLTPSWRGIALGTVADANQDGNPSDPAIALLADHDLTGKMKVEVRRVSNGVRVNKINFLSALLRPIDVVVIDDTNGDGNTNDTSIGVLAQRRSDGKIIVQIRSLASGALVRNIVFFNISWSPVGAAVVNRTPQVQIGNISPLIGVLGQNDTNGKRLLQSRLVSNGALDKNIRFFNSLSMVKDVTVLHDVNGDGVNNDPGWQVLAISDDDNLTRVETRMAGDGSRDKTIRILNSLWQGSRLVSSDDFDGNVSDEVVVSLRKRADDTRRIHVKDYESDTTTININP